MKKGDYDIYFREPTNLSHKETVKGPPVRNIPSEEDPTADDDVLEKALLRHCKGIDNGVVSV